MVRHLNPKMDANAMKTPMLLLCVLLVGSELFAAPLIPCPDCEKMVSRRAFMCPNCGLKGDVIAEAAAELERAKEPPPPDDRIVADFGDRKDEAMPVMFGEKPYAVMPLEKLVGLKTLTFLFASTNAPINYASIEIADSMPLVRFGITETNLLFKAEADVAPTQTWARISPMKLKKDAAKILEERRQKK